MSILVLPDDYLSSTAFQVQSEGCPVTAGRPLSILGFPSDYSCQQPFYND
jgi:hypothetical protein